MNLFTMFYHGLFVYPVFKTDLLIVCPTLFNTLESCPSICTMVNTYTFFNKCVMTLLLGTDYEHSLEVSICDMKVRELFKNK
jgi:hypothetical protein